MENPKYDIIVFGGVCCDIILSGINELPKKGEEAWAQGFKMTVGGVFNVAAAAARLNLRAGCPCALGTDGLSDIIRRAAKEECVDANLFLNVDEPYEQLSVVCNYGDDRSFISYAAKHFQSEYDTHLASIVSREKTLVAVFGISDKAQTAADMRAMRDNGAIIVLDCSWNKEILSSAQFKEQVAACDWFFSNAKEAQEITGMEDAELAAGELSHLCKNIIIKMSSKGAMSYFDGNADYYPAYNFGKTIDTTGAGDNFVAGFCYGLVKKLSKAECVRCGLLCGSKSVLAAGGFTSSLYEGELKQLLSTLDSVPTLEVLSN